MTHIPDRRSSLTLARRCADSTNCSTPERTRRSRGSFTWWAPTLCGDPLSKALPSRFSSLDRSRKPASSLYHFRYAAGQPDQHHSSLVQFTTWSFSWSNHRHTDRDIASRPSHFCQSRPHVGDSRNSQFTCRHALITNSLQHLTQLAQLHQRAGGLSVSFRPLFARHRW